MKKTNEICKFLPTGTDYKIYCGNGVNSYRGGSIVWIYNDGNIMYCEDYVKIYSYRWHKIKWDYYYNGLKISTKEAKKIVYDFNNN